MISGLASPTAARISATHVAILKNRRRSVAVSTFCSHLSSILLRSALHRAGDPVGGASVKERHRAYADLRMS
jgi:hypothetical protein